MRRAQRPPSPAWPVTVEARSLLSKCRCGLAGVWAAIGTDAAVRHRFYEAANWCYQAGVFISRRVPHSTSVALIAAISSLRARLMW